MAAIKIGSMRTLACGCVNQYGMWSPNVPSWGRVSTCRKHESPGKPWLAMGPGTFDTKAPPQPLTLFAEPDRLSTPDMFADQP